MADIAGLALTSEDEVFLLQPEISGLILFSRNYENPQQLSDLCASIHALRSDLVISVDQEGGRVQRFKQDFLRLPSMSKLGEQYSLNSELALQQSKALGWLMAAELIEHGVDISFAPVLDIDYSRSSVIGDRAFSNTSDSVYQLANQFIEGMSEAGMSATAKHFPGHGYVEADSHLELPTDQRSKTEIFEQDIVPFQRLINENKLSAVMPAHVIYPAVDKDFTAGFSTLWLQKILRQQLGFAGLIYSDDLSMEGAAASGAPSVRAEKAKAAGCNVLLICNHRDAAQEIVNTVRDKQWPILNLQTMKAKPKRKADSISLYESKRWNEALAQVQSLLEVQSS
jgi:beta-N-acetylhexosaminidase